MKHTSQFGNSILFSIKIKFNSSDEKCWIKQICISIKNGILKIKCVLEFNNTEILVHNLCSRNNELVHNSIIVNRIYKRLQKEEFNYLDLDWIRTSFARNCLQKPECYAVICSIYH